MPSLNPDNPLAPTHILVDIERMLDTTGLTKKQFAKKYGLSYYTVCSWVSGERSPRGVSLLILKMIERYPDEVEDLIAEIGTLT